MSPDMAIEDADTYGKVFPLRSERRPAIYNNLERATRAPEDIRELWADAFAPVEGTGWVHDKGEITVDIDPRNGGSLESAASLGVSLDDTRWRRTGGGGWHLDYTVPTDLEIPKNLENAGYPGVDIKGQGTGYVALPGTRHPEGEYTVGSDRAVAPAPEALLEAIRACTRQPVPEGDLSGVLGAYPESEGRRLADSDEPIPDGRRNDSMYAIGLSVIRRFPEHEARERFEQRADACVPLLDDGELRAVWQSAWTRLDKEGNRYDQIAARETVSPSEEVAQYEQDVAREARRLRVLEEARRQVNDENTIASWHDNGVIEDLDALLARPDEEDPFLIDQLWRKDGNVILSAEAKAGKSVAAHNAIRSLADGTPFLGEFSCEQVAGNIVLLNVELSENNLRAWLRQQGMQNTHKVKAVSLRGKTSWFAIQVSQIRAQIAAKLRAAECETLVIDPVGPLWDAFGIQENDNTEIGGWLTSLDELKKEAGVSHALLVVHAGHSGVRARGASKQEGWPDSIWNLRKSGEENDSPREFSARGRDVGLPPTRLGFDLEAKRLTALSPVEVESKREGAEVEMVLKAVVADPGVSTEGLKYALTMANANKAPAIKRAISAGLIRADKEGKATCHYPAEPIF